MLTGYAGSLLGQIPCMRMGCVQPRKEKLTQMEPQLDGIIYHTVKFCDIYSYEYADMKDRNQSPSCGSRRTPPAREKDRS